MFAHALFCGRCLEYSYLSPFSFLAWVVFLCILLTISLLLFRKITKTQLLKLRWQLILLLFTAIQMPALLSAMPWGISPCSCQVGILSNILEIFVELYIFLIIPLSFLTAIYLLLKGLMIKAKRRI